MSPERRIAGIAFVSLAIGAGVALRIYGLFTDFWLDEIWGLQIARAARSSIDLITRIHVDTNHPLILMWMRLVGNTHDWEWYRLPSLIAGVATIPLLIEAAATKAERWIIAVIASLSLPLIVYSSEARGYALAAALLIAAYVCRSRRSTWGDVAFGFCIALSFLAHLGAATVYAGFLAADLARRDVRRHALPMAAGVYLYVVKVRHLVIIGSPRSTVLDAVISAASGVLGVPGGGTMATVLAVAVVAVIVYEIARRALHRDVEAVFYAVAIAFGPAAAAAQQRCLCVVPRYFFLSVPFVLLLFASFVAHAPRIAAAVLIAVFVIGNTAGLLPFLRYGRGEYLNALADIARSAPVVTIGGTNDFRTLMTLDFYTPYLPAGHRVAFVPRDRMSRTPPDWILLESVEIDPLPPPRWDRYVLTRVYPYGGFSGWTWIAYRKPDH
jgi:hypothetical protein